LQQVNALPAQLANQANNALPANTLELKDIHVPEQISDFPIAYGWWLLGALIVLIIITTIIKIRKSAKRNQVKKQAVARLKNNTEISDNDIIALLKWAAMHYFSRAELAKLFGDSLQQFLISKLPSKHQQNFAELSKEAFLNQYRAHKDVNKEVATDENLHRAANLWLSHALPPKSLKTSDNAALKRFSQKASQGVSA
jgi:ABC-type transport system involved in Fe-S cluster assembly fused permease/ATPase subunit